MTRVFIDANVLFAAALSLTGASHEILREGIRGNATIIVSDYVLREAERNLDRKQPLALPALRDLLEALAPAMVNPTQQQVLAATAFTEPKDAPVIAAAQHAEVDFLVTLDRRHLINRPEVAQASGLRIVLPDQLLEELRRD
jgi:uncharacterized protein